MQHGRQGTWQSHGVMLSPNITRGVPPCGWEKQPGHTTQPSAHTHALQERPKQHLAVKNHPLPPRTQHATMAHNQLSREAPVHTHALQGNAQNRIVWSETTHPQPMQLLVDAAQQLGATLSDKLLWNKLNTPPHLPTTSPKRSQPLPAPLPETSLEVLSWRPAVPETHPAGCCCSGCRPLWLRCFAVAAAVRSSRTSLRPCASCCCAAAHCCCSTCQCCSLLCLCCCLLPCWDD